MNYAARILHIPMELYAVFGNHSTFHFRNSINFLISVDRWYIPLPPFHLRSKDSCYHPLSVITQPIYSVHATCISNMLIYYPNMHMHFVYISRSVHAKLLHNYENAMKVYNLQCTMYTITECCSNCYTNWRTIVMKNEEWKMKNQHCTQNKCFVSKTKLLLTSQNEKSNIGTVTLPFVESISCVSTKKITTK